MSGDLHIVVIDTQGRRVPDAFRRAFSWVHMDGIDLDGHVGPYDPHGCMVASKALIHTHHVEGPVRLTFIQVFRRDGRAETRSFVRKLEDLPRIDVCVRSWGRHIGEPTTEEGEDVIAMWRVWTHLYNLMLEQHGAVDVAAAGNDDRNNPLDDMAYPQALMRDSVVVGSVNPQGIPSVFSGDSTARPPDCVCVGERVRCCGPDGKWVLANGTSFAAPQVAGWIAQSGLGRRAIATLHANAYAGDWSGALPHPKWGYGNVSRFINATAWSPVGGAPADEPVLYMDQTTVPGAQQRR